MQVNAGYIRSDLTLISGDNNVFSPLINGLLGPAQYIPGMESSTHTHSGPEVWYTVTGETCLETPDGRMVGRAGGPPVIVPAG